MLDARSIFGENPFFNCLGTQSRLFKLDANLDRLFIDVRIGYGCQDFTCVLSLLEAGSVKVTV